MADTINVPTFEQIETILSKLATNYSNLAIVFYDIFYNTTPMDVTFQMYDEAGVLQTYTIPNRAKDMSNILNGSGSPQGNVEADRGVLYQDLLNGDLYIKLTSVGNIGWTKFITNSELQNILLEGVGSPEAVIIADRGTLYVDRADAGLYIKTTLEGNTGWLLISANTETLANRDLSNLTTTGEGHFANLSLNNINLEGQAKFNAKENTANKVTVITINSTDTEFPSAKAVYTFVNNSTINFADRDFNNISHVAESKFLGINKIKSCILEAPTIIYRGAENSFILPQGTVLLCANGLSSLNTLSNIIINIDYDIAGVIPTLFNSSGYIFYDSAHGEIKTPTNTAYFVGSEEPPVTAGGVWFDPTSYTYHVVTTISEQDTWTQVPMVEIGRWSTDVSGDIKTFDPYRPVRIVEENDIKHVVIETGGTEENWYRLYKDGWIEAGGCGTGDTNLSFNKNFKTTNYTFVASGVTSYTKAVDGVAIVAAGDFDWIAKGQVA